MENHLDILLVSEDELIQNQILNSVDDQGQINVVLPSDVMREVHRQQRDIVIFVQPEKDLGVELIQFVKSLHANTLVIFIAKSSDFTLLRSITKAGADDFFVFPDEFALFISRFPTIIQNYLFKKEVHSQDDQPKVRVFGRGRGQIVSFYSGNGGTGRSLIASTLAQSLRLESTAEVILIDLNFQYGGIETLFSIESNRSIADLIPVIEELNESHIRNVAQTETYSQMEILVSPCDAEVAETLNDEFIAKLLRTCRRSFDYVVIDLPTTVSNQVVTALEESDKVYYVLSPKTPSLKILNQFEQLSTRLGIELQSKMEIVINQISKENEIQEKDLKGLLRYPIASSIRKDSKSLQTFVNKGEALRKQQKERKLIPFAKDVTKFAHAILK